MQSADLIVFALNVLYLIRILPLPLREHGPYHFVGSRLRLFDRANENYLFAPSNTGSNWGMGFNSIHLHLLLAVFNRGFQQDFMYTFLSLGQPIRRNIQFQAVEIVSS